MVTKTPKDAITQCTIVRRTMTTTWFLHVLVRDDCVLGEKVCAPSQRMTSPLHNIHSFSPTSYNIYILKSTWPPLYQIRTSRILIGFLFIIILGPRKVTMYRYTSTINMVGTGECIKGQSVVLGSEMWKYGESLTLMTSLWKVELWG